MRLTDWLRSLRGRARRSKIQQFAYRGSRLSRNCEVLEERIVLSAVGNTVATAQLLSPVAGTPQQFLASIGDESGTTVDADLFRVDLTAGQQLTADIDAQAVDSGGSLSSFNGFLRLFNSSGTLLASNDNGRDPETGVFGGDSLLTFTASVTGTYYLGVSSAANQNYDPITGNSSAVSLGVSSETGDYQLQMSVTDGLGWSSSITPAVSGLGLVNDTGIASDGITSDPRISVGLAYASGTSASSVWIQYDLNGDGMSDGTASYMGGSQVTLDLGNSNLSPGTINLSVRGGVCFGLCDIVRKLVDIFVHLRSRTAGRCWTVTHERYRDSRRFSDLGPTTVGKFNRIECLNKLSASSI